MITLINLPQLNSLDDKLDPPLGLMYIAAAVRQQGKAVKIVDLSFVDKDHWKDAIGYADVYGMTVFSASLYLAEEVQAICKSINPNSIVVAGGPHPTSLPEETVKLFDNVVCGEGEYSFGKLFGEHQIIRMPVIEDLDALPLPARDLVDLGRYTRKVNGKKITSITTSRGCPYGCAFCCKDVFGSKVRHFSVDRVVSEITHIKENYDIHSFIIYDDTFVLNRPRFTALCNEFSELDITYRCNGDARNNTAEDFKLLYKSGCREIAFGVESGSQKVLDFMGKGATVGQNKAAIINAKEAGLITKAYLMVGSPGEDREAIEATKRFITEADPDQYTLFQFVPLPGCAIWKDPDKYGVKIVDRNFQNYYNIAGKNEGGLVIEGQDIPALKKDLLGFLQARKQRGLLQDYYK